MKLFKACIFLCLICNVNGQPSVEYSAIDIQLALNKLNVLGSVLYVAAHPDDENQAILAYMGKGRYYQTAYLSLTRGDGGQNLLGPEKGDLLGVLRTQELLAARRMDGAQQYFTRAIDFGYSKSAEESLTKWDRNLLLGDVVKVIRQTRPDVIVTRFSEHWGGHGHHISSAILAKEAFSAAADPDKFPEQSGELEPWQAQRIFWNTWRPQDRSDDDPPILSLNLGTYNPLLGLSYREIAALGRSMHKTQGFGSTPQRGESLDYFMHTSGSVATQDLFDNVDTSWKRVAGCEDVPGKVEQLIAAYDLQNPQASIPGLIDLYKTLDSRPSSYWIEIKKNDIKKLLQMCSGLWLEAVALNETASPGDSIEIQTSVLNRSDFSIRLERMHVTYCPSDSVVNDDLINGQLRSINTKILIPRNSSYSQPYWLINPASETMFNVTKDFKGLAVEKPQILNNVTINFSGLWLDYEIPVLYKWNDPVQGEKYKPFYIEPQISIALSQNVYVFADDHSKEIIVNIVANKNNVTGKVKIDLPAGWLVQPAEQSFKLSAINQQQSVSFKVSPQKGAKKGEIVARAFIGDKSFDQQLVKMSYEHIPQQNILLPARAKLIKPDIIVPQKRVAYIMGSGDEIPQSLEQIGISVDLLSDEDLQSVDYKPYDAVICGVRAFNTREDLGLLQNRILDYVEQGGVWIVQHNTRFGSQVKQIGPYPYVAQGRSRISEENTPVKILEPAHALLNYPNKITQKDFDNWVQERGTYMAESWDDHFIPLISGHDKGEEAQKGGLLYAKYGKGVFIFSGFSWFRQLPAGVPGAYRLFVNMICAGDKNLSSGSIKEKE